MNTNTLTPVQRLTKTNIKLMANPATIHFSALLMVGKTEIRDDIPTACTDGVNAFYGEEFIAGLTDAELAGLILHENIHKAYQHCWMWEHLRKENTNIWAQAIDHVTNHTVMEIIHDKQNNMAIKLPEPNLCDPRFKGMTTEQVFRMLQQEQKDGKGQGQQGFDEHQPSNMTAEEKKEIQDQIMEAIRQGQMLASKQVGNKNRIFEELLEPKVDWREQLREFMSSVAQGNDDSTWRRPRRKWLCQDLYMPSLVGYAIGDIVVGIDTSGSIGDKEVQEFISEVVSICETVSPERLHLIECDSKVQAHEVYLREDLNKVQTKRSVEGGGGTDMGEITRYVEKHNLNPEVIVVLTDGYTPWPNTIPCPTLWAITTKNMTAPIGVSITLE